MVVLMDRDDEAIGCRYGGEFRIVDTGRCGPWDKSLLGHNSAMLWWSIDIRDT